MPDRSISIVSAGAVAPGKSQTIARKGPTRATAAQFLPIDQRRGIYRAFHDAGRSVEQIAASSRIPRLVQDVLRRGRDEEIGRQRQMDLIRRAA